MTLYVSELRSALAVVIESALGIVPVYGFSRSFQSVPSANYRLDSIEISTSESDLGVKDVRQNYLYAITWARGIEPGTNPAIVAEADAKALVESFTSPVFAGIAQVYQVSLVGFEQTDDLTEPMFIAQVQVRFEAEDREHGY